MITHFFSWNSTKISMIIITKHESHTFKFWAIHKTGSCVITIKIRFHFLVQSKHSWHIIKIFINIFFDKPILSFQNITKQINIIFQSSILHDCSISFATHSHSNDIFKFSVTFQTVFPEFCNAFFIRTEIPSITINRIRTTKIAIFFTSTATRLMMTCSHNNAKFIGKFSICKARTIITKTRSPHCRPQIVTF